MTNTTKT